VAQKLQEEFGKCEIPIFGPKIDVFPEFLENGKRYQQTLSVASIRGPYVVNRA